MLAEVQEEETLSQLKLVREKEGFGAVPFFSDENLHAILSSLENYQKARAEASPLVQDIFASRDFLNSLLGIFPENFLAMEKLSGRIEFSFPVRKDLRPSEGFHKKEFKELEQLLEKYLSFLRIIKVFSGDIFEKNKISMVNENAVRAVFAHNNDVFPVSENPIEWLTTHQSEWRIRVSPLTMIVPPSSQEGYLLELKYGLLSGFPREDCEIFSKMYHAGPAVQDYSADDIDELQEKTHFQFRVLTATGYTWLKAANELIEQLNSFGFLPRRQDEIVNTPRKRGLF